MRAVPAAAYLAEYTGATKRFFEPTLAHSADVRLSFASQADIFRYLLNYVRNDTHYSEQARASPDTRRRLLPLPP